MTRRTGEYERIVALPRRVLTRADATETAAELSPMLRRTGSAATLLPWQAVCLVEALEQGGLWCALPVGQGKTLLSYLLPRVLGARRPMLIVPKPALDKTRQEFGAYAKDWGSPDRPFDIRTWNSLSPESGAHVLDRVRPDLIIVDESHKLANRASSASRRIDRYIVKHQDDVKFVAMTGTPSRKSIMHYWHLACWALRDGVPLPRHEGEALEWAAALDEGVFGGGAAPGVLGSTRAEARQWYRSRLVSTPGVVVVDEDSAGTVPLTIRWRIAPEDPIMDRHYARFLGVEQCNPAGIEVTDPLSRWRLDAQLGAGFYSLYLDGAMVKKCRAFMSKATEELRATLRESTTRKGSAENATRPHESPRTRNTTEPKRNAARQEMARRIIGLIRSEFSSDGASGSAQEDLETALRATLLNSTPTGSNAGTGSIATSTSSDSSSAGASAKSASDRMPTALGWITVTGPASFADCCAGDATQRSELSAIAWQVWKTLSFTCYGLSKPPTPWADARRTFARFVRDTIDESTYSRKPLDTEAQVIRAHKEADEVAEWLAIKPTFKGETVVEWFSFSAIDVARAWLAESPAPGIVWVGTPEFGHALAKLTGLSYYGSQGCDSQGRFLNRADPRRSLIASWNANKEGFNLQPWTRALICQPPQSALYLEQIFGRNHRRGIDAEVVFDILISSGGGIDSFETALGEAATVKAREGLTQKILRARIERAAPVITPSNEFRWAKRSKRRA